MNQYLKIASVCLGLMSLGATACKAATVERADVVESTTVMSAYVGGEQWQPMKVEPSQFAPSKGKLAGNTPAHPLRYIGVLKSGNVCPTAKFWTSGLLFEAARSLVSDGSRRRIRPGEQVVKLPAALQRFCVYTWAGKGTPVSGPNVDQTRFQQGPDPDLDTVIPQSPQSSPRNVYYDSYLKAAGAEKSTLQAPTPANAPMVAVVDTVGFTQGTTSYTSALPRLRHGLSVAGMIRGVRCPHDDKMCVEKLFHTQAFPYNRPDPNTNPNGGVLGSQGSLAQAIAAAILHWQQTKKKNPKLVVNLSVAWDPKYGGALPNSHMKLLSGNGGNVPGPVQAVHAAIAWGACQDVLFVAASGNHEGDSCTDTGMMAPASWSTLLPPSQVQCMLHFGTQGAGHNGELVYAVGGLDYQARPISKTRADSMPARAAVGFMGVGRTRAGGKTGNWTGTSVATATVSAIAARLWTHAPQLSSHQIMAVIDNSGWKHSKQQPAKLITAYRAQKALCSSVGCTNPYQSPQLGNAQSNTDGYFSQWATGLPTNFSISNSTPNCKDTTVSCGSQSIVRTQCDDTVSSPNMIHSSALVEPWIRPQPEIPVCPVCPTTNGNLTLTLDPDYGLSYPLTDPVFAYTRASGQQVEVRLGNQTINPNSGTYVSLHAYSVRLVDSSTHTVQVKSLAQWLIDDAVTAAELRFQVQDAAGGWTTVTSSVTVYH